jgi:magnesium-protoporphyrin IX monomethyl ester (oxidative) cyclase
MPDVVFVNMPFAALERPSLGLGTLKAILARDGISSVVRYPNLAAGERMGAHTYQMLARMSVSDLLLEWVFTKAAFPEFETDQRPFMRFVLSIPKAMLRRVDPDGGQEGIWSKIDSMRNDAAAFVDGTAREILALRPRIIGCTSTFQQHVASIALLRRVRELDPAVVTMMGGANCETRMGMATHKNFPWIDYIVSGEADGIITPLCRAALEKGRDADPVLLPDGVIAPAHRIDGYTFRNPSRDGVPRALFSALDELPIPDLGDYFDELEVSPLAPAIQPALVVETSRGCWWGAIKHCTFCGLNGSSMGFRIKSPDRAYEEFRLLTTEHGVSRIQVADNILDMNYFPTLVAKLAETKPEWNIFYETKANLRRWQLKALADAGIHWLQPGIESLSTPALKLMEKGTTAWRNVLLLKWAREQNIYLVWFMLWGFPGEDDSWYAEVAEWLPLISHLQYSNGLNKISYDRFSPYEFRAAEFGLDLQPIKAMRLVYPMNERDLRDQSYFFDDENERVTETPSWRVRTAQRPGVRALHDAHEQWRREFHSQPQAMLSMEDDGGRLHIVDTRSCALRQEIVLQALEREVYLACEDGPITAELMQRLERAGNSPSLENVTSALSRLREERLLLTLDGHNVALALPAPVLPWTTNRIFPGGEIDLQTSLRIERERIAPSLVDHLLQLM